MCQLDDTLYTHCIHGTTTGKVLHVLLSVLLTETLLPNMRVHYQKAQDYTA